MPGAAAAPAPRRAGDRPGSRAKAGDAFRRLRGAGKLTNRLWIVCLGYRRFLFESERVREPASTMPLREALDVADTCLNPLNFLGGD